MRPSTLPSTRNVDAPAVQHGDRSTRPARPCATLGAAAAAAALLYTTIVVWTFLDVHRSIVNDRHRWLPGGKHALAAQSSMAAAVVHAGSESTSDAAATAGAVPLPIHPHEQRQVPDAARTTRVYGHVRECLRMSDLPECAAHDAHLPTAPPTFADLEAHFHDVMQATARWRCLPTHTYSNYSGPWLENHWISTFQHKPFTYWYPFVPLLVQWTDACVGNDTDSTSWKRAYTRCEELGFLLGRLPLPARNAVPRRPASAAVANVAGSASPSPSLTPSPTSTRTRRPRPGTSILRKDVIYITVVQDSQGLRAAPDCYWIRNVLILGAGGFGNVPIPLIKDELPLAESGEQRLRSSLFTFTGKAHYNRSVVFDAVAAAGYPLTDARAQRLYQGRDWKRIMLSSLFTLAPRAIGSTSFRLYEALQLGVVPVYVWWQRMWLPYHDPARPSKSLWLLPRTLHENADATDDARLRALWGDADVDSLAGQAPAGIVVSFDDLHTWVHETVCDFVRPNGLQTRRPPRVHDDFRAEAPALPDQAQIPRGVAVRKLSGESSPHEEQRLLQALQADDAQFVHEFCDDAGVIVLPPLLEARRLVAEQRTEVMRSALESVYDRDAVATGCSSEIGIRSDDDEAPSCLYALHDWAASAAPDDSSNADSSSASEKLLQGAWVTVVDGFHWLEDCFRSAVAALSWTQPASRKAHANVTTAQHAYRELRRGKGNAPSPTPSVTPSPDPAWRVRVHPDSFLARMEQRIAELRTSHFTYAGVMRQIDLFIREPGEADLACVSRPAWRPPGTGWFTLYPNDAAIPRFQPRATSSRTN